MFSRRDVLNTTIAAGAGLAMASQAEPAQAQRGAKVQPGGSACGNGTVPGIVVSCALTPSGALAISAAV